MFGCTISGLKRNSSTLAMALAFNCMSVGLVWADGAAKIFDIPAESADKSLIDFSKQAGVQIMAPYSAAAKINTPSVKGEMSAEQALAKLLDNSGLEVASRSNTTIYLRLSDKKVSETSGAEPAPANDKSTEVVVTGTRIRNSNPTSPLHVVSRMDIEQSGDSQIGDVVRSLPENFAGGQNPGVFQANSANIGNQNATNSSTINLRGLGTDATLVLLNGHRLASDFTFQGSDISGIPLEAVERIEIVTDGASALYGSDAVAGVANIVLRKNFNGGEIGARFGAATQGGDEEQTYNLLLGKSDVNNYGLVSAEYSRNSGITAGARDFTAGATPQTVLFEPQKRSSLFLSGGRELSDIFKLSFDALVSDRQVSGASKPTPTATEYLTSSQTPEYSVAGMADLKLPSDWNLHLSGVASGSRDSSTQSAPSISYSFTGHYRNDVQYVELSADGSALTLPTGDLKTAVGVGYRVEGYQQDHPGLSSYVRASRNISYLFGEALVPLVQPSEERPGLKQLEISLSGRVEDSSEYGKSADPKIGLRYVPFKGLTVRGTWGTSFKAPSFTQLYSRSILYVWPATTLGYKGSGTALMTYGGNPKLQPEKSRNWTVGGDFVPAFLPSAKLSVTLFNIDYKDRVVQPVSNYYTGLSNPIYQPFVESSPTAAQITELQQAATVVYNYSGAPINPSSVVAVLQDKYQNAAAQTATGLDLAYRQEFQFKNSNLTAYANATWLRLHQQTIVTAPDILLSGTLDNPPSFRARAGLAWQRGGLSINGIGNFVSSEIDNGVTPNAPVSSWTTVDANISYRTSRSVAGRGIKFAVDVANLFDRRPPYTVSPTYYPGLHYDSTNASIIGRTISFSVSDAW